MRPERNKKNILYKQLKQQNNMKNETKIELLCKARNILHNKQNVTNLEATMAHDLIDMVLDDIVKNNFVERQNKNLKLYCIAMYYGGCIVAAEDELDVLCIISKDEMLRRDNSDSNGNLNSPQEILEFVTEIPGYSVKGKSGILYMHQE